MLRPTQRLTMIIRHLSKCFFLLLTIPKALGGEWCYGKDKWADHSTAEEGMPWITNIVTSAMMNYFPYSEDPFSFCSKHGKFVEEFSANYTLWALSMIDSNSRGPAGYIYGNTWDYGHFDQCVSVKALDGTLKGKYMMVSLEFYLKQPYHLISQDPNKNGVFRPNESFWSLQEYSKKNREKGVRERNKIYWAVCVPNSCTNEDVEFSLNQTLWYDLFEHGFSSNVTVMPEYTRSSKLNEKLMAEGPIFFLSTVLIMGSIVLMSTLYDCMFIDDNTKYLSKMERTLKTLSLKYNLTDLLKNDNSVTVMSGMKVMSMFFIIFGHRMMISMFSPLHNTYDNEQGIRNILNTYYYNGILIVDTFLVITGFLSYNKMLKIIETCNYINPVKHIYRRYIRFTPTYAFVLGYVIWIHPYLNSGPMPQNIIFDSSKCYKSWWTHLLYVNNYIFGDSQCIIPSWYMAADMQLYIFCILISYLTLKSKKLGISLLIGSALLSALVPAVIILIKGYKGITLIYLRNFSSYYQDDEFIETYFQTHFRASPYIIGMLAAWIYRKIEQSNVAEYKRKYKCRMALATVIMVLSMNIPLLAAWRFYKPEAKYSLTESLLYAVLHRFGWAIPISWLIVLHSSNLHAPFQKILSFSIFGPLNKVGYSVLLVHTLFQLYIAGMNRTPIYYNWLTAWWMAAGDIVFSYAVGVVVYLFIESPFNNLFKS